MPNPNLQSEKEGLSAAEKEFENNIRPSQMEDFSGQQQIIENLRIFIKAAKMRDEAWIIFCFMDRRDWVKPPYPGLLPMNWALDISETSGPVIEKPGDLAGLLTNLEPNDVLFIDEIHRLSTVVEEYLYAAMEDYRIDIMIDTGPNARSIQLT